MNNPLMPNFLIVGAAKAGTTSLYHYLNQHPDVFFSSYKEPCFFCYANNPPAFGGYKPVTEFEEYKKLFEGSELYTARGEASTLYSYLYETTIENIKKYVPDYENVKIIFILRNPVERAYSQYTMNIRDVREKLSFKDALAAETGRMQTNINPDFFYANRGYYYDAAKAYTNTFKNVKIYLFEDLVKNPHSLIKDVCNFLKIDPGFKFEMEDRFNVSGKPKVKWLNKFLNRKSSLKNTLRKMLPEKKRRRISGTFKNKMNSINLKKEALDIETRKQLQNYFKEDIYKLQDFLQIDLSHWLRQ